MAFAILPQLVGGAFGSLPSGPPCMPTSSYLMKYSGSSYWPSRKPSRCRARLTSERLLNLTLGPVLFGDRVYSGATCRCLAIGPGPPFAALSTTVINDFCLAFILPFALTESPRTRGWSFSLTSLLISFFSYLLPPCIGTLRAVRLRWQIRASNACLFWDSLTCQSSDVPELADGYAGDSLSPSALECMYGVKK